MQSSARASPLPFRERVVDPSATRVDRVRGAWSKTPHPARCSLRSHEPPSPTRGEGDCGKWLCSSHAHPRDRHPESRERPADGPALRLDRGGARADLRPDGYRQFRPRRVPDAGDVCDVRARRRLRARPAALGAARCRGAVRVRRADLSRRDPLRHARQNQRRHGADLRYLRARHRHARPGAIFVHARLPLDPGFLARRQDREPRRHLFARAAARRRADLHCGLHRALSPHQPHRFRPRARGDTRGFRGGGAGRHRQEPRVRARLGTGRGAGRARRRHHGDLLLHLSRRRRLVRADRLCHRGARRVRQRVRRLHRRHPGGPGRGRDRDGAAGLAEIGGHLRRLSRRGVPATARPVRIAVMIYLKKSAFRARRLRDLVVAVVIAVVIAALPLFVSDVYVQNILVLTLMYAALSQSWNILGGYCGQISLGHALYFGVGAYTTALLFSKLGVLPWFGMAAGGIIAALIALALGYPCFRLRGHYFAIATIVIAEIGYLLFLNWDWAGAATGIDIPIRRDSWLTFQFMRSKLPYIYFALVLACITWLVTFLLENSKWGYWWRAVKDNPEAAESLGVVLFHSKMAAAAVSAFFTAVGGSFYAQFVSYIDPDSVMSFRFSLLMALPAVLGGIGTLWGPALGAAILIPLTELTRSYIGGTGRGIDLIVYGTLVVVVALARPEGMLGLFTRRRAPEARA